MCVCCVVTGVHYFRSLSPDLPCEMLYPVFLMYNQDGLLGAFGWLFQGSPAYYTYEEEELSWFKLSAAIYPVRHSYCYSLGVHASFYFPDLCCCFGCCFWVCVLFVCLFLCLSSCC